MEKEKSQGIKTILKFCRNLYKVLSKLLTYFSLHRGLKVNIQRGITWFELNIFKVNKNIVITVLIQTTVLVWPADHPSKGSK